MPHYRLYRLRVDGSIAAAEDFVSDDDAGAMSAAATLRHFAIVEVWCGARVVGRVAASKLSEIAAAGAGALVNRRALQADC